MRQISREEDELMVIVTFPEKTRYRLVTTEIDIDPRFCVTEARDVQKEWFMKTSCTALLVI